MNLVPSPKQPEKRTKITGTVALDEIPTRIGQTVYKFGRTTLFTRGTFENVVLLPTAIRLPDRKVYLYEDVLAITHEDGKPFSKPGDSGALVYTDDSKGLGLVVGASDKFTYISPLASCLTAMQAKLLI